MEGNDRIIILMQELGHKYLDAGYGARFSLWLLSKEPKAYNSRGSGSAMRVSSAARRL